MLVTCKRVAFSKKRQMKKKTAKAAAAAVKDVFKKHIYFLVVGILMGLKKQLKNVPLKTVKRQMSRREENLSVAVDSTHEGCQVNMQ